MKQTDFFLIKLLPKCNLLGVKSCKLCVLYSTLNINILLHEIKVSTIEILDGSLFFQQ